MMPILSTPKRAPLEGLEGLMAGYQQTEEAAARELIEKVTPLLLRYFLAQEAHRRWAEDLVQETWIRIHKARHTHRPGEPVLPWVFAIARYTGLDHFRKTRRVEAREEQVEVLPERPAAESMQREGPHLDELLEGLPASQRDVIVMLKVSGMSIEEVARATATSTGSVKQKAHRAYEALRAKWAAKVGKQ